MGFSSDRVHLPKDGALQVCYTLCPASGSLKNEWLVVHHGICHTREHFPELIEQLNLLGFHVVMIEQLLVGGWLARNSVTMKRHREGMAKAVRAAAEAIRERDPNYVIAGYVCHSMGAQICEEMQQTYETLRYPTVFMAPMPVAGAFWTSIRILLRHPVDFARAVVTLSVLTLVKKPERTQEWFFDSRTPEDIYRRASVELRNASFLAFLQIAFRFIVGLKIVNDKNRKFMLMSATDELFYPWQLKQTRKRYPQMEEEHLKGGHDFFVQYAVETAEYIRVFFDTLPPAKRDEARRGVAEGVRPDPAHPMPPVPELGKLGAERPVREYEGQQ
jgi:hypothetical protein